MRIIQSLFGKDREYTMNGATYVVTPVFRHHGIIKNDLTLDKCIKKMLQSEIVYYRYTAGCRGRIYPDRTVPNSARQNRVIAYKSKKQKQTEICSCKGNDEKKMSVDNLSPLSTLILALD